MMDKVRPSLLVPILPYPDMPLFRHQLAEMAGLFDKIILGYNSSGFLDHLTSSNIDIRELETIKPYLDIDNVTLLNLDEFRSDGAHEYREGRHPLTQEMLKYISSPYVVMMEQDLIVTNISIVEELIKLIQVFDLVGNELDYPGRAIIQTRKYNKVIDGVHGAFCGTNFTKQNLEKTCFTNIHGMNLAPFGQNEKHKYEIDETGSRYYSDHFGFWTQQVVTNPDLSFYQWPIQSFRELDASYIDAKEAFPDYFHINSYSQFMPGFLEDPPLYSFDMVSNNYYHVFFKASNEIFGFDNGTYNTFKPILKTVPEYLDPQGQYLYKGFKKTFNIDGGSFETK